MNLPSPRLVVFTTLFPHSGQPGAGLFIRERMFRLGKHLPLVVVAPVPWFPFQAIIRRWRPGFRPDAPRQEDQQGYRVYHPRFLSVPGFLKSFDGWFMAVGSYWTMRRLKKEFFFDFIDAHFAYPDGYAAGLLGKWLNTPVTITLRGTEKSLDRFPGRRKRIILALQGACRVFSVSQSLKDHAVGLGIAEDKIQVVGNGVDCGTFYPIDQQEARARYSIPLDAKVLISVGGLVPRKGFHRVIEILPKLVKEYPQLIYLIVGGPSPEGDMSAALREQVERLGLQNHVRFLGALPSAQLHVPLSAADVFVLATSNEGWANVFLEAMACGLPVVTTEVGGNREVVCTDRLGRIVAFGDSEALLEALRAAIDLHWDTAHILAYAGNNAWDKRISVLRQQFFSLMEAGQFQ